MPNKIEEELLHRKYTLPGKFWTFMYHTVGSLFVIPPYNYKYTIKDNINDCKGPCFLIWNHLSRRDHLFLMKASYPRRLSIITGHNEFYTSHLHFVLKHQHNIPKKIFADDLISMRGMRSIIKQNGCIALSPEGTHSTCGHNQPAVAGTGNLLKHYGIPVYFLKLKGSYLTSVKQDYIDRHGKVEGEMSLLFSPEQLQELSGDEIQLKIDEAFRHDDYEWNKVQKIKYDTKGHVCKNLDQLCYKCPKCGFEYGMTVSSDTIQCTSCGNGASQDNYYEFHPFNPGCVIPESPSKWYDWERSEIIKEIQDENFSLSEKVDLYSMPEEGYIPDKKSGVLCGSGTVTIDHRGFHFRGTKRDEEFNFDESWARMYDVAMHTAMSFFSYYFKGDYYEFHTKEHNTMLKLVLAIEEMHRYHFNTWKNFPWCDWMYKGMKLGVDKESK